MQTSPVRVVLNCDTKNEIDDQLAISYALGVSHLHVLGVISVQNTIADGGRSLEIYHQEAERITSLCGRGDLPCLRGGRRPMEDVYDVVRSEGLDFLLSCAAEAPFTLLATGPATDIAAFTLAAPAELADRVSVIWAGGFPDQRTWERHKFGELNARADIHAWRRVFASTTRLTVLPGWPAVQTVRMLWPDFLSRLRRLGSPLGDYLAGVAVEYASRRSELDMDAQREEKVLWDIVNVAAVSIPEAVILTEQELPSVDPAGAPDWSRPTGKALFGLQVDESAILDDFWTAMAHHGDALKAP
jgi:inosine-uridine nucleoside N-ribohydrolase